MEPSVEEITRAARDACCSLSACENFFNFDKSNSWLGWENWLTVDIVRRLNHASVIRFGAYPGKSERSDILVRGSAGIAVEIKVNYVDANEVQKWKAVTSHKLPDRAIKDLQKLKCLGQGMSKLMLFAVAFENPDDHQPYKTLVANYLKSSWSAWLQQWYACETFLLLALSSASMAQQSPPADVHASS